MAAGTRGFSPLLILSPSQISSGWAWGHFLYMHGRRCTGILIPTYHAFLTAHEEAWALTLGRELEKGSGPPAGNLS